MSGRPAEPAPRSSDELISAGSFTGAQRAQIGELAERVFGHVLRTVDLDALYQIEQCMWSELDRLGLDDEDGDLASALISEALHRVGRAPDRHLQSVPRGISRLERIAAEYDEACVMCRNELEDEKRRLDGTQAADDHDPEWVELTAQAAAAWRTEHAEALRRFGVR